MSEKSEKESNEQNSETPPKPPGAPDRTQVKEPDEKNKPMGDPQLPSKKKTPKLALVLLMILNSTYMVHAQTGSPSTLGHPTYPSSGSTRNRGNVMGGESSATKASNLEGPIVPTETPSAERQEAQESSEDSFKLGPYNKEGEYHHLSPDEKN